MLIKSEIENQIYDYLMKNVEEERETDSEEERETDRKKAKESDIQKIKEEAQKNASEKLVKQYEKVIYSAYAENVSNIMFNSWMNEIKIKSDKALKSNPDEQNSEINGNTLQMYSDIYDYRYNNCEEVINKYIEEKQKIDKKFALKTSDEIWDSVTSRAENIFSINKVQTLQKAKELKAIKIGSMSQFKINLDLKAKLDKINQQIAEIPLSIEDKMQEIKDLLDTLLGRYLIPIINPDAAEFDLDILLAQIDALIQPLLSSISPLESVGGKVPIIGDLSEILVMLANSKGDSKLSKEEVKKAIGDMKPELPSTTMDCIIGIKDDIMILSTMFPMILINIIFQMLDTIVGLLKQLGLSGPYPLTLIPAALDAVPKMNDFVKKGAILLYAAVKGLIKDKLGEAMALSVPSPNFGVNLESLIPEVEDSEANKPSAQSKPTTAKTDYTQVITSKLKDEKVQKAGYSRKDLTKILHEYKKIYNGTKVDLPKYSSKKGELKVTQKGVKTIQGTPEHFEQKLTESIQNPIGNPPKLENGIKYEKINEVKTIVGDMNNYNTFQQQIQRKEKSPVITYEEKLEP